jgi:hypothetical protein
MQMLLSKSRENARRQAKQQSKNSRPQSVYVSTTNFSLRRGSFYLLRAVHAQGTTLDKEVVEWMEAEGKGDLGLQVEEPKPEVEEGNDNAERHNKVRLPRESSAYSHVL